MGVPHRVSGGQIILAADEAYALVNTLTEPLETEKDIGTLEALNHVSPVK